MASNRLNDENAYFPIFFACDMLNSCEPGKNNFLSYLYKNLENYFENGTILWQDIVKNEKVFLMLDGLNEIFDLNQKSAFIQDLKKFIDANKSIHIIITERVNEHELTLSGNAYVETFQMEMLSDNIIDKFLNAYLDKDEDKKRIRDLLGTENVGSFVQTPYYLSKLIEVTKSGKKELPTTKETVLEDYIKLLLAREKDDKSDPSANYIYILPCLVAVAMFYEDNDRRAIPMEKVVDAIADVVKEKMLTPDVYAADHIVAIFEELHLINVIDGMVVFDELLADFLFDVACR